MLFTCTKLRRLNEHCGRDVNSYIFIFTYIQCSESRHKTPDINTFNIIGNGFRNNTLKIETSHCYSKKWDHSHKK